MDVAPALSTTERTLIWLRQNLFRRRSDYILTPLAVLLIGYVLYRLLSFVFVTGRWEIVRANLTLFLVGDYPRDELWRPAMALIAAAAFGGLVAGYTHRRHLLIAPDEPRPPFRRRVRDLFFRLWPALLGVLLLLLLAETITPWLIAAGALAAATVLYAYGRYFPDWATKALASVGTLVATAFFLVSDPFNWIPDGLPDSIGQWAGLAGAVILVVSMVALCATRTAPGALIAFGFSGSVAMLIILTNGRGWDSWGGLMLNIFLSVVSIALCFPLGVLLALGRQAGVTRPSNSAGVLTALLAAALAWFLVTGAFSKGVVWGIVAAAAAAAVGYFGGRRATLPVIRALSTAYIELIRGVPLFTLLLMAVVAVGLFVPESVKPGLVARAIIVFTLFTAAYVAEIVRGGLQSLPNGQTEAAQALGLSPVRITFLIVLPQALRNVIPALVGQFISLFKDTTLAGAAMGLTDLLAASQVATSQPDFQGQRLLPETIAFVMMVFWVGSITMSRESQRLEHRLGVGTR